MRAYGIVQNMNEQFSFPHNPEEEGGPTLEERARIMADEIANIVDDPNRFAKIVVQLGKIIRARVDRKDPNGDTQPTETYIRESDVYLRALEERADLDLQG